LNVAAYRFMLASHVSRKLESRSAAYKLFWQEVAFDSTRDKQALSKSHRLSAYSGQRWSVTGSVP